MDLGRISSPQEILAAPGLTMMDYFEWVATTQMVLNLERMD
jgi:hypothetical protein